MAFLVVLGVLVAGLIAVMLLKLAFGVLGWIVGNLLWVGLGFAGGYVVAKRDKAHAH